MLLAFLLDSSVEAKNRTLNSLEKELKKIETTPRLIFC